ncbi:MAG: DUF2336 domain-containing protein [Rhodospirillaceae bacterium]|nr:DUF2336 domain-containing protein [Rhodospirillaceae bacterium]
MPGENETTIDALIELARDRRRASRQVLFSNVVDLFLSEETRISERERSLMTGILRDLIRDVEFALRKGLADRLKDSDDAPPELIALLANDEIEIAGPILRGSPALQDPQLVDVIRQRGREHWLAITMRRSLSGTVTDALVATGDADVIESLLGNANAELSRAALEYLVVESQRVDRFQRPLLLRSDVPADLAMRMYWWVSAALREHLLRHYAVDADRLDMAVEATVDAEGTATAARRAGSAGRSATDALVNGIADATEVGPSLLIRLLRSGRIPVFVGLFARYADLPERAIRRIVLDGDGESLAMICRANRVDRNDFGTLFMLIQSAFGEQPSMPPQRLQHIMNLFDETRPDHAARALSVWRRHPEYLDAIEALEEKDVPPRQHAGGRRGIVP